MGSYRRMGNVEQHLGNATPPPTPSDHLIGLWKSPWGTVLSMEALALVAIAASFFLAAFGSCRRWSNRWIVQKVFLVTQALSLSLGTYSIGVMQTSSVKNEMYPTWAVSLLTLFGCVDPVIAYNGLDYMGPLSKMVFNLCLYCGYVVLMSVSITIPGVAANGNNNLAIVMLSAITFMGGFHRSLALVLPAVMRDELGKRASPEPGALAGYGEELEVPPPDHHDCASEITMADIRSAFKLDHSGEHLGSSSVTGGGMTMIEDVCLGYTLSRLLQRRFLGLDTPCEMEEKRKRFESLPREMGGKGERSEGLEDRDGAAIIDYKRTLKTIEIELAFLYEVFFTSNQFLQHYEAKSSSFWVLASFIGICFVGVETAILGLETMTSGRQTIYASAKASTSEGASALVVIGTTTADLIVTLVILASLALLQLVQLMRCWTSNWARVSFAYEYAAARKNPQTQKKQIIRRAWMLRLKEFAVTRINWFDKYLWQDKLGQYSVVVAALAGGSWWSQLVCCCPCRLRRCRYEGLPRMLGMEYVGHLLGGPSMIGDGGAEAAVRLHEQDDVKVAIAEFLGKIKSRRIGVEWSSVFSDNGLGDCLEYLPIPCYSSRHGDGDATTPDAFTFTHRVLAWHIATCYCELVAEQEGSAAGGGGGGGGGGGDSHRDDGGSSSGEKKKKKKKQHRPAAIALSKYCVYTVVSAPELLPGPSVETKRAYEQAWKNRPTRRGEHSNKLKAMQQVWKSGDPVPTSSAEESAFKVGVYWGKRLLNETETSLPAPGTGSCSDHWKVLALLWVQTLLYAAPYGDVQRHLHHLSQGGEFITHLWALLYHIGIDKWEREEAARDQTDEASTSGRGKKPQEIRRMNTTGNMSIYDEKRYDGRQERHRRAVTL